MDTQAVLVRLVREHTKGFIRAARCFPTEKLTWRAGPNNRTPLDILQEVATISTGTPEILANRKMAWSPEEFAQHQQERSKLTDLEEIISRVEASTDLIVSTIEAVNPATYDQTVEMPWPGDFRIVDILTYHLWNLNYHEGQLVYILTAMGLPTPFDPS
jgi:uncharacterized damage-inducible protein DinB